MARAPYSNYWKKHTAWLRKIIVNAELPASVYVYTVLIFSLIFPPIGSQKTNELITKCCNCVRYRYIHCPHQGSDANSTYINPSYYVDHFTV